MYKEEEEDNNEKRLKEMEETLRILKNKLNPDPKSWKAVIKEEIIEWGRNSTLLVGALCYILILTCLNTRLPLLSRQTISLFSLYVFNQIGFFSFSLLMYVNLYVAKIPLHFVSNVFIVMVVILYIWRRLTKFKNDHFIPFTGETTPFKYNLIVIIAVVMIYLSLILQYNCKKDLVVFGDELTEIRQCIKTNVKIFKN